eukprot:gene2248-2771_t
MTTININNPLNKPSTNLVHYVNGDEKLAQEIHRDIVKELITWKERMCVPGLSACVMVKGKTIFKEGFGYSDIENAIPVDPSTKMRIASISKSLTSAAVGTLLERGKLSLDDSIYRWVPTFPKNPNHPEDDITIRHLAAHLSGIRHYSKSENEFYSIRKYKSKLEDNPLSHPHPLEIFITNPWVEDIVKSKPGHYFNYTTFGYTLLGTVIENITGVNYQTFMRDNVFNRCGMFNTVIDEQETIIPNRSKQYCLRTFKRSGPGDGNHGDISILMNAEYTNSSYKWAGGGFLSTSEDICRFGSAIIGGRLLKRETIEKLFTPQETKEGKKLNYGLGWFIKSLPGNENTIENKETESVEFINNKIIYHPGGAVGGTTTLVMIPKEGIVVCILANQENTKDINECGMKIASLISSSINN